MYGKNLDFDLSFLPTEIYKSLLANRISRPSQLASSDLSQLGLPAHHIDVIYEKCAEKFWPKKKEQVVNKENKQAQPNENNEFYTNAVQKNNGEGEETKKNKDEEEGYMVCGLAVYRQAALMGSVYKTGCANLDFLLAGGIRSGELLEFFGPNLSYITHTNMSILGDIIAKDEDAYAIYIHTGGHFNCLVMKDILTKHIPHYLSEQEKQQKLDSYMERIRVMYAFDCQQLSQAFQDIEICIRQYDGDEVDTCRKKKKRISIIVIDCIAHIINSFYGTNFSNQHILEATWRYLRQFATDFFIAIITTNHSVTSMNTEQILPAENPTKQIIFYDEANRKKICSFPPHETYKPALGKIWSNAPHTLIQVEYVGRLEGEEFERKRNFKFCPSRTLRFTLIKSFREAKGRHCYALLKKCGLTDFG